jgi:hypothetical protein
MNLLFIDLLPALQHLVIPFLLMALNFCELRIVDPDKIRGRAYEGTGEGKRERGGREREGERRLWEEIAI